MCWLYSKNAPKDALPAAALVEVEITNLQITWLFTTSAGGQYPSFSVTERLTVKGER